MQQLLELSDDQMRHSVANIIANLSGAPEKEELLMQFGVLGLIQNLNSHVHRTDTMCFVLLRYIQCSKQCAHHDITMAFNYLSFSFICCCTQSEQCVSCDHDD